MGKVNLKPKGQYIGSGNVYKIRSTSDFMGWHFVAVIPQSNEQPDEVVCSCKGFQNHKKCWHIEAVTNGDWDE